MELLKSTRAESIGSAVVFDLDGVLADNTPRLKHIRGETPDWDAFHADQHQDCCYPGWRVLVNTLWDSGITVFFVTNRREDYREVTEQWLDTNDVRYDYLRMRVRGEDREQSKLNHLRGVDELGYTILFVVDDDPELVAAFGAAGYTTIYAHSGYYDHPVRLDVAAAER
jgi:phosphoglycolate phosphatase-like HAD superfamily hydrolase